MAIEPQVFICYGRPDKDVAYAIATEFWRRRIESYNYLGKPIEDRLFDNMVAHHLGYIYASRLFIAIISKESIPRFFVTEEIARAQQIASISEQFFRVYILKDINESSFPEPELVINWANSPDPVAIVSDLLDKMGNEFIERNQKGWEINKSLFPDQWKELDAMYAGDSTDV